jgi:hypothetical protein
MTALFALIRAMHGKLEVYNFWIVLVASLVVWTRLQQGLHASTTAELTVLPWPFERTPKLI